MGLFQWTRGQLGREDAGVRKEWDREEKEDRLWIRRGQAGCQQSGPSRRVVQKKEGLGWRDGAVGGAKTRTDFPASVPS